MTKRFNNEFHIIGGIMESFKENEKNRKRRCIAEEKDKIMLFGCLALGIIAGSITCAVYGSEKNWSGTVESFCASPESTAVSITAVTIGFIAISFICGLLGILRFLIYPAMCFRGMGLGALTCGILSASGTMGLCFAALVTLPYAVINCALTVYAGEFFLGIHRSFTQKNTGLTKGLILHTIKIFTIYLLIAAASCALFVASCYMFGKYLL